MNKKYKKNHDPWITAEEFDAKFERGENIFKYLDFKNALAVKKINVDFPIWMVKLLDEEAKKLNISRQAVIKTWIHDRLLNIPQFSHKGRF